MTQNAMLDVYRFSCYMVRMSFNRFSAGAAIWFLLVIARAAWWLHSQQPLPELPRQQTISAPVSPRAAIVLLPPCEDDGADQRLVAVGFQSCR